jgi:hypothetical protein
VPALLPQPDPDGLLEYSVVYTDRSLNHMSQRFQGVMKDIARILKTVYNGKTAIVVPGSGTFGMEAVARQFATDRKCLIIRNGWFSFRWTQILDMGRIPSASIVLKARRVGDEPQSPFIPPPIEEVVARIREEKPDVVFAPHVETASGMILPNDYLQCRRGSGARGRWSFCPRLRRFRRRLGRHGRECGRRTDQRPPERLDRFAVLRPGGARRACPCQDRRHYQQQLCLRPQEVDADHGDL